MTLNSWLIKGTLEVPQSRIECLYYQVRIAPARSDRKEGDDCKVYRGTLRKTQPTAETLSSALTYSTSHSSQPS